MTAEPSINKDIRNRNKMRGTLYLRVRKIIDNEYSLKQIGLMVFGAGGRRRAGGGVYALMVG